jgi:chemotaxis protein methyltransferase CheR
MQEHGFRSMEAFVLSLEKNREVRRQVEKLMTISISRFFRDRNLWRTMEKQVLPAVVAREKTKIKVWSAGCASEEEIYSFKILWEEWARNRDQIPELGLWATDMNPALLDRARTGVYSSSSLKEVHEEWRSKYFSPVKANRWTISDFLKEGIHWKVHNLLAHEPPFIGFQIIFLRNNLLTYYKDEILKSGFAKVVKSLSPGGFLIIGSHEKLPREFTELPPLPHHPNIFQKIPFTPSPL